MNPHAGIAKLRDLIQDIDFGMLTTTDEEGRLHSRPMSTIAKAEFDGDLWFFTYAGSHKVFEVQRAPQVNVSFAAPQKQRYVSLSGRAELVRDKDKMQSLWEPALKAWFPLELDTPDIVLLKVHVEQAEYWDAPAALVENEKVDLT